MAKQTEIKRISAEKRKLNKLRNKLIDARERWLEIILEKQVLQKKINTLDRRSPQRVIYLAYEGEWWKEIKKEICSFNNRIKRSTSKHQRQALWIPTAIEFPNRVQSIEYLKKSVRKVSFAQATAFAKKSGWQQPLEPQKRYLIKGRTGKNYKLKVVTDGKPIEYLPFTDWVICICKDEHSIPKLKRKKLPPTSDDLLLNAICTHKNCGLFKRKKKKG